MMGQEKAMEHEHLLYDIWLPDGELLKYVDPLRGIVVDAALRGGADIYYQHWHQFEPWGVTGFLLLKESHISIHTWPEEDNFAAVDIFPCGPMDTALIVRLLREALRPVRERLVRESRGSRPASLSSHCSAGEYETGSQAGGEAAPGRGDGAP